MSSNTGEIQLGVYCTSVQVVLEPKDINKLIVCSGDVRMDEIQKWTA